MTATSLVADAQEGAVAGVVDSDGNVPVRSVCFGAEQFGADEQQYVAEQPYVSGQQYAGEQQYTAPQYAVDAVDVGGMQFSADQYGSGVQYATGGFSSEQLGLYTWTNDGYATYGEISIDDCALEAMGAGPEDRERVLAHERGHANGLLHSSDPNDIMYSIIPITGT